MRDIDKPDQAGNNMGIPEKVRVDGDTLQEERQEIPEEGNPVVGARGCKICHIDPVGRYLGMGNPVSLDKETGQLKMEDK